MASMNESKRCFCIEGFSLYPLVKRKTGSGVINKLLLNHALFLLRYIGRPSDLSTYSCRTFCCLWIKIKISCSKSFYSSNTNHHENIFALKNSRTLHENAAMLPLLPSMTACMWSEATMVGHVSVQSSVWTTQQTKMEFGTPSPQWMFDEAWLERLR